MGFCAATSTRCSPSTTRSGAGGRSRSCSPRIASSSVLTAVSAGHAALDAAVAALQARFPDFVFSELSVQALPESGRLHWGFGPPSAPPRVTGLDVILVRDGKIATLLTFLDPSKPWALTRRPRARSAPFAKTVRRRQPRRNRRE